MTDYLVAAKAAWEAKKVEIDAEFVKQEKRTNRSSETRVRKALRAVNKDVYVPYRDASLEAAKLDVPGV